LQASGESASLHATTKWYCWRLRGKNELAILKKEKKIFNQCGIIAKGRNHLN